MNRTTITANPVSYHQALSAFRTADASAIGTGSGGIPFVNLKVSRAIRNRLVRDHLSEARPTRIKHGFGHSGFRQLGRAHVSNGNEIKFPHQTGAELVQKITAPVGNLHMYAPSARRLAGLLHRDKSGFAIPEPARRLDLLAVRERGKRFEAKVDSDAGLTLPNGHIRNFDHQVEIPAPRRVLGESASVPYDATNRQLPGFPDREFLSHASEAAAERANIIGPHRDPAKALLSAVAQPRPPKLPPTLFVPPAYSVYRLGADAKFFARAAGQGHEVKRGRPFPAPLHCMTLHVIAVIPNDVRRPRHAVERKGVLVLDAIAIGQMHVENSNRCAPRGTTKKNGVANV